MLGDAYGAAVVEALSKKELEAMDEERRREDLEDEDDLESAQTDLKGKKVCNIILSKKSLIKGGPFVLEGMEIKGAEIERGGNRYG